MSDDDSMQNVSHTHPYTGETFGTVFTRGPAVADGGVEGDDASETSMRDVDHTPHHGTGAESVWTRGVSGRGDVADE